MVDINVSEIFQKLRTKTDVINFFREQSNYCTIINHQFIIIGLYYPNNPHFNKSFLLEVLSGKKKLLPLGCLGGFAIPYYTKNKTLTKEYIFKLFLNDQNLMSFLPDNPDIRGLSREFLLSVLFYASRDKYLFLYEKYKNIQIQKTTTGNKKYIAKISEQMLERLKCFQPVNL